MTSSVSTVSGFVANGHQTVRHVSYAPSKIPYGGFSPVRLQTGFRRRPSSQSDLYAATVGVSEGGGVVPVPGRFHVQSASPSSDSDPPVQRPLAPHWVLLSQRIIAYYGLIRASRSLPTAYCSSSVGSFPLSVGTREGPHFTLRLCSFVPPSLPRQTAATARDCSLAAGSGLRQSCSGSASASPRSPVHARPFSRLQSSLHAAARRMVRPSPERTFTLELSPPKSPRRGVEYRYAGKQSIPATGLSPARHAALWAANRMTGYTGFRPSSGRSKANPVIGLCT